MTHFILEHYQSRFVQLHKHQYIYLNCVSWRRNIFEDNFISVGAKSRQQVDIKLMD